MAKNPLPLMSCIVEAPMGFDPLGGAKRSQGLHVLHPVERFQWLQGTKRAKFVDGHMMWAKLPVWRELIALHDIVVHPVDYFLWKMES